MRLLKRDVLLGPVHSPARRRAGCSAGVKEKLQDLSEEEIGAAFAGMATDPDYQRDAVTVAREFVHSDWAAFKATEKQEEHDTNQPQTVAQAPSR
ncbi:MAG: hypothetical protein ACHP7I_01260 [Terriglobales bacterium]